MKLLTTSDQFEDAKQWAYENLPRSVALYSWLKIKLEYSTNEHSVCYADQWPHPNIIATINFVESYGFKDYPLFFMFSSLPKEKEDIVESFLVRLCDVSGLARLGGLDGQAIGNEWSSAVHRVFADRLKLNSWVEVRENRLYYVTKDVSDGLLSKHLQAPEGLEFDKVNVNESEFVNSLWRRRVEGSEKLMEQHIREFPSSCLREPGPDRRLASFELMHCQNGLVLHLCTLPEFRRRGLATLVEQKLVQGMVQIGFIPAKTVLSVNEGGVKMTEASPWWTYVGDVFYMRYGDEKMASIYKRWNN